MKKSPKVVLVSDISLVELRDLRLHCDVVAKSKCLSLRPSLAVQALGIKAKRVFQETGGDELDAVDENRQAIANEILEKLKKADVSDEIRLELLNKGINAHDDAKVLSERELAILNRRVAWNEKTLLVSNAEVKEFGDPIEVEFRGLRYRVDPYAAFLALIENEILIVADEKLD